MKYYIEITLIENTEKNLYQLWTQLYGQLHLAFVEQKDDEGKIPFGVSFPQYYFNDEKQIGFLGSKLRIFADNNTQLQQLNLTKWLTALTDFIHITTIKPLPEHTQYATYQRKQFKTSAERLAKHRLKHRQDLTYEQAIKHYTTKLKKTNLPYVQLKSCTTNQTFKLFIEKTTTSKLTVTSAANYSSYGLSSTVSVPEF